MRKPAPGRQSTNTRRSPSFSAAAGHDVYEPPFERIPDKPPVPTLALWSRRDGIVAPSAARGLPQEIDKAVEIDTHHVGFALYRPALSQVVREIRNFLTEMEGHPPGLRPMADIGPLAAARAVFTA